MRKVAPQPPIDPTRPCAYLAGMNWQGRIIGDNRIWGAASASPLIVVGDEAIAPHGPLGKVLPEGLASTNDTYHLPAIGQVAAVDRLSLIGFQSLNPYWDGVAVIVGVSATIWATLSAGEVIHQQGSATPQMAAALSLDQVQPRGMEGALDRPERLPLLLHSAAAPEDRLGALMGAEVGATRTLWLGQQAVLLGDGALTRAYGGALSAAHVPVTLTDSPALKEKGFSALASLLA